MYKDFGYRTLRNTINTRIFELINDLSASNLISKYQKITDSYLNEKELLNLKKYYDDYNDIINKTFARGYCSLYLYQILFKERKISMFLTSAYKVLTDSDAPEAKKILACNLIIEFGNKFFYDMSDRTSEELYYKMEKINMNFDDLDYEKIVRNNSYSVDYLYSELF